ncbi:MAG: arsenate reductase (azurin) large subunit [Methyloligellaceae bacterium]
MSRKLNRREILMAARSPSVDYAVYDEAQSKIPVPPANAKVHPTACDYCIVGCGYKAYTWPVDEKGGSKASENAFKADFPVAAATGNWVSPNMHNIVKKDGKLHHVVVVPDGETAVNRKGNHSVRGGAIAQKPYNPKRETSDRLQAPLVRVNDSLLPISWDDATSIVAELSKYTIEKHGVDSYGMKYYSYQYWENTYALTKLIYKNIGTPVGAEHDKPTASNDATGLDDSGVDGFSSSYADWQKADVIYMSGFDPYENHTILFTEWIAPGGAKIIFVNPRKSPTAVHAERTGGLHLQLQPGTDSILNNAIARHIVEQGWEDKAWIKRMTASRDDINKEKKGSQWRRRHFGHTYDEHRKWLLSQDAYKLENAAKVTGIPVEKIKRAADMLARPRGKIRPKASFMLEKGNYWSFNFPNSASLSSLGLMCGAGSRPGHNMARAGGHQRGGMKAAGYPLSKSPVSYRDKKADDLGGAKIPINFDEHAMRGKLKVNYILGTTWLNSTNAAQSLRLKVGEMTRKHAVQASSLARDHLIATFKKRIDEGGMFLIQQDIYANDLTDFADIVLPAATWGEVDFVRAQGERRLRIYSAFYDPPGQAKPDWWIIAQIGKKMGFKGFDWKESNDIFEEAAPRSKGGPYDYRALVKVAKEKGMKAHELLRSFSTTGIQLPARMEDGKLVGTARLHDETFPADKADTAEKIVKRFKTASGKAIFMRGDWALVEPVREKFKPTGDELWVINGRINHIWQSMFDDLRKAYVRQRYPSNFLMINPADAKTRGVESGDLVAVENDKVIDQLGNRTTGTVSLVAYVTDEVAAGVTYTYAFYPGQSSNILVSAVTDPVTGVANYKIGKGRVRKIGETPLKKVEGNMSFIPRTAG